MRHVVSSSAVGCFSVKSVHWNRIVLVTRPILQICTAAWLVLPVLSLCGCGGSPTGETAADKAAATAAETEAERCEKKLSAALFRLQPEAMATNTRRETVVNALNSWLTTCGAADGGTTSLSAENAALLSPAAQRFAGAARFTENDTLYVRDCLLLRGMTEAAWKQADLRSGTQSAPDRERVVHLFQDVVRMVTLLPADEQRVPVSLFEVLLTGRGTVDDRIWVFCEALRQRQLDAFILQPVAAPEAGAAGGDLLASAERLLAVAVDSDVLLFDPASGSAVPAADAADVLISAPAGLQALQNHDRWKAASVQLVAQAATFAPRMLTLQQNLPASEAATLYEELAGGNSDIQPLLERVMAAGQGVWTRERISLWDYPEVRTLAAGALSEEHQQAYRLLLKPYDAPFERDPLKSDQLLDDPGMSDEQMTEEQKMERRMAMLRERYDRISQSSDELFGKASQRLLKVRLEQIMGAADVEMIQQLQQIRIASMQDFIEIAVPVGDNKEAVVPFPLPEAIRAIHRSATADALFWTAQCQVVRGDYGAAVTTFRNYRRQYPEDKWRYPSLLNEGVALIQLGDSATAATVLAEADVEQNAERRQIQWLLQRLQQAGFTPAAAPAAPAEPAAEPAGAAPAEPQPSEVQPPATEPKPAEPAPAAPEGPAAPAAATPPVESPAKPAPPADAAPSEPAAADAPQS